MNNEYGHWLNCARHTKSPNERTMEMASGAMLWHIPRVQISQQWLWPLRRSSGTAQNDNNTVSTAGGCICKCILLLVGVQFLLLALPCKFIGIAMKQNLFIFSVQGINDPCRWNHLALRSSVWHWVGYCWERQRRSYWLLTKARCTQEKQGECAQPGQVYFWSKRGLYEQQVSTSYIHKRDNEGASTGVRSRKRRQQPR